MSELAEVARRSPVPAPLPHGLPADVFARFQRLIHREAGIWLSEMKKALLVGRLARRVRDLGLPDFAAYYRKVEHDAAERVLMLDAICTNETQFFREPAQFEYVAETVVPRWIREAERGERPRRVRAWSAGCSTGEEPFSLAMLLRSRLPEGWSVEILATDLSTKVLDRARQGIWPLERSAQIPEPLLKRFMLKGTGPQEGRMKAGPELASAIRFERVNLADERYLVGSAFDLILCRNVLIYFDAPGKAKVISRLLDHLAPAGLLFLGHAESLAGICDRVRSVASTVYALRGGPW